MSSSSFSRLTRVSSHFYLFFLIWFFGKRHLIKLPGLVINYSTPRRFFYPFHIINLECLEYQLKMHLRVLSSKRAVRIINIVIVSGLINIFLGVILKRYVLYTHTHTLMRLGTLVKVILLIVL